jgi:cytoskeletal protein RodZ
MATVSTPTSEDRRTQVARSGTNGNKSLGEMLRRARELRGLTLERIARDTKIPQRHLEAFERDNLTAVPAGFYQRAELRTYAQAVGLDQRLALAELESALAPAEPREPSRATPRSNQSTSPLPYIAVAVAGIAVVAVLFGRASVEPTSQLAPAVGTAGAAISQSQTSASSPEQPSTPESVASDVAPASVVTQAAAEPTQAPVQVVTGAELIITTEPEGARVTVNGIGWGSSPVRIPYLEAGQKTIRVSKEGYVAVERVLHVDEGRRQTLNIRLDAAP